jgi:hypothetical protein
VYINHDYATQSFQNARIIFRKELVFFQFATISRNAPPKSGLRSVRM